MALELADVLSPAGDINGAVWFPSLASGAVDTLVTGFLTDAATQAPDNDAEQKLWVYYRAATEVADRMTVAPASWSGGLVDQATGSETRLEAQIQYWIDKAAAYLAAFNDAIADEPADSLSGWSVLRSLRHA